MLIDREIIKTGIFKEEKKREQQRCQGYHNSWTGLGAQYQ
jgi:hypothetical protein